MSRIGVGFPFVLREWRRILFCAVRRIYYVSDWCLLGYRLISLMSIIYKPELIFSNIHNWGIPTKNILFITDISFQLKKKVKLSGVCVSADE